MIEKMRVKRIEPYERGKRDPRTGEQLYADDGSPIVETIDQHVADVVITYDRRLPRPWGITQTLPDRMVTRSTVQVWLSDAEWQALKETR